MLTEELPAASIKIGEKKSKRMSPPQHNVGEGDFCLLSRQTIGDKGSTVVLEF